jgi:hypothetical protein
MVKKKELYYFTVFTQINIKGGVYSATTELNKKRLKII